LKNSTSLQKQNRAVRKAPPLFKIFFGRFEKRGLSSILSWAVRKGRPLFKIFFWRLKKLGLKIFFGGSKSSASLQDYLRRFKKLGLSRFENSAFLQDFFWRLESSASLQDFLRAVRTARPLFKIFLWRLDKPGLSSRFFTGGSASSASLSGVLFSSPPT
jgi:hypothetical protein